MIKLFGISLILLALCQPLFGCGCSSAARSGQYAWTEITRRAAFPEGYNYPVFVTSGGEMLALNDGGWVSKDGKNWTKTALQNVGLNPAYQDFVQFKDAIYALGAMEGNYTNMRLSSKISRTADFQNWETLAEKSNLPARVFYGTAVFRDKIWLVGGYDGKNYHNDIWNSSDGVNWRRVSEKAAWTPRNISKLLVFKNRLWFMGGGVIDGEKPINPNSGKEVWTSGDGLTWEQVKINAPGGGGGGTMGGTPVVFDDKLWLVGANRSTGNFGSAVFVSEDMINWQEQSAPWSPRGGTVVWTVGDKLYMTGGKYSYRQPGGEIKFVYSNDVWAMSKKTE